MRLAVHSRWARSFGVAVFALAIASLLLTGVGPAAGTGRLTVTTSSACAKDSSGRACALVKAHSDTSFGQLVVDYATNEKGQYYCWDGGNESGPNHGEGDYNGSVQEATDCAANAIKGFDCTGLALYAIFKAGGPDLFSDAHGPDIVNYGTQVPSSSEQVGDILVFGSGPGLHVGIYAGLVNGVPMMIDSNTKYFLLKNGTYRRPDGVFEEPVSWELSYLPLTSVLRFSAVTNAAAPVPTTKSAANHVLRVSATGAAYLVDASGVPHWIPDELTYACDIAKYPLWNGVTQVQVNTLGNGQPWATLCTNPEVAANHILVVSATNTSYWADASGAVHWIPSTAIFECFVGGGVTVLRGLSQSQVNALGNGKPWASCSSAPPSTNTDVIVHDETSGSVANTWTDYADASGTEGPSIASKETVQISCRAAGYAVADGNNWWYEIASGPWDDSYWVSADAFYNNGAMSGSLAGTPFFDSAVPVCGGTNVPTPVTTSPSSTAYPETTGSVAHTWTDYQDAGGAEGTAISSNETVQISCRAAGYAVADGNNWWYQVESSPWSDEYWVSADAFYNNGATSGSLSETPFFDPNVPLCSGSILVPTPTPTPTPVPTPPVVATYPETTGSVAHTWTDYQDAGGTEGTAISSNETVQISCRAAGYAVADGNNWWYQVESSPWSDEYWVSADAFYNNGATSGSLVGTPFFDPNVLVC